MLFWYVQQSGGKDPLSAVKFKQVTETDVSIECSEMNALLADSAALERRFERSQTRQDKSGMI